MLYAYKKFYAYIFMKSQLSKCVKNVIFNKRKMSFVLSNEIVYKIRTRKSKFE